MSTDTRGPDTTPDVALPASPITVDPDAVLVASLGVTADVIDIGRRIVEAGRTEDPDCRCCAAEAGHKHPPHDPKPPPPPPPPARPPRGALSLVPPVVDHSGVVRRLNGLAADLIDEWPTAGTDEDVQRITECVAQIATALLAGDIESARAFLAVADEIATGGRRTGRCPVCFDEMWVDELGSHVAEAHG